MRNKWKASVVLLGSLFSVAAVRAQQTAPASAATRAISAGAGVVLDVVVAPKGGRPVADLQPQDFTVVDSKAPQTISGFRAVTGRDAAMEVVVVLDAVNADPRTVSVAREQIDKFLKVESGHLTYPTTIALLTDKGLEMLGSFSTDGTALSATLAGDNIGLRILNRSGGVYGEAERLKISWKAFLQLVYSLGPRPGRKVILFVSPGWPLLSGPNVTLDEKQQQQIYGNIMDLSTRMREGHIRVYSVSPIGAEESVGRSSYYQDYIKGASKVSQVSMGNMALQVLAIQSGGKALDLSNDISGTLQDCLADSVPFYEIAFTPSVRSKPSEFHPLEVTVNKPGLTARTNQGYYTPPK
jgi:VWFA-related protein